MVRSEIFSLPKWKVNIAIDFWLVALKVLEAREEAFSWLSCTIQGWDSLLSVRVVVMIQVSVSGTAASVSLFISELIKIYMQIANGFPCAILFLLFSRLLYVHLDA